MLENTTEGTLLMDNAAPVIAARFDSWAVDYAIEPKAIASAAVRLSTLIAEKHP
jgi:hypothetical protein